ncbi:Uncharacterized protein OBRU01_12141 [Operophtera brumata]|uniref:Sodium/solute symporter n=1 Tax=Operophtera brumata TaxID=104452 RepID=A0A0L7LAH7_OPEBR|nr:Uncharacterized protein OBRU01_12141 [Operophtera brumata]
MSEEKLDVAAVRASMQHFTVVDYVFFVFMLAICGGIGVYFGFVKKQRSTQDYLMGGRNMKLVPYLELRYDKRLRVFGSVIFSVYLIAWLPIVIYVPALAFNQVTGVNIHIVTPLVCFVCIFYTSLGGLKAVVWTDVIQTIIMFGAMILVIVKGSYMVGGFGEVIRRNWESNRIEYPTLDLTERHSVWSVSIGSAFYWIGNIAVNQSMMQRFLSLPDLKQSKRAVWGFLGGVLLIVVICGYSGLVAFARYHDCDPLNSKLAIAKDQILPLLVTDILADWNGLPGIFVAGVFSAALSSLSTGLNSMAAVVLEDFWKPFFKELTHTQTVLTMSLSSASMGPLTGVFLMGILLPFIDSTSALSGGVIGLVSSWWVAAHSQLAQAQGMLKFVEKPRFTHNCTYTFNSTVTSSDDVGR